MLNNGFRGFALIDDSICLRCTDMNANLEQNMLFFNHIMGLRDTMVDGAKREDNAESKRNIQQKFWRPGVKIIRGTLSFPLTASNVELFNYAKYATKFSLSLFYTCGTGIRVQECYIESFNININSGDIVNCSMSIVGRFFEGYKTPTNLMNTEKLVTWDSVSISVTKNDKVKDMAFQKFTLDIKNEIKAIYTSGGNNNYSLYPYEIRIGTQTTTGDFACYNDSSYVLPLTSETVPSKINISIGGVEPFFNQTLIAVILPLKRNGAIGPIISSYAFNAVGIYWDEGD